MGVVPLIPRREILVVVISPFQITAEKAHCLMSARAVPKCGGSSVKGKRREFVRVIYGRFMNSQIKKYQPLGLVKSDWNLLPLKKGKQNPGGKWKVFKFAEVGTHPFFFLELQLGSNVLSGNPPWHLLKRCTK